MTTGISGTFVRLTVPDKCVQFRDPCFNCSLEIPPIKFFSMDALVKFGDSKSNGSRDIRGADFVSNEQDRSLSHKHFA